MNRKTLPLTLIARSPHGKCSVAAGFASAWRRRRVSAARAPGLRRGLATMARTYHPGGGRDGNAGCGGPPASGWSGRRKAVVVRLGIIELGARLLVLGHPGRELGHGDL